MAQSMRWVLMTPFGCPVEPEVKRIFATVSGPTSACAASTAGVACAPDSFANGVVGRSLAGFVVVITSTSGGTVAAMARANTVPFAAKTRPGVKISMMPLSFLKSCETNE